MRNENTTQTKGVTNMINLTLEQYESCAEWAVDFFAGAEEIGSSDENCCIWSWCKMQEIDGSELASCQWQMLKRAMRSALGEKEVI